MAPPRTAPPAVVATVGPDVKVLPPGEAVPADVPRTQISPLVTAGCVALALALKKMMDHEIIDRMPLRHLVAATSVGMIKGEVLLDLDYSEDSNADIDMNVVETDQGQLVEVQASAEKSTFSRTELEKLIRLADKGIKELFKIQKELLKKKHILFMAYK